MPLRRPKQEVFHMEIERKWLIEGFPAGLPLVSQAAMRQGYILSLIHISEPTRP